jgi:hypothetical protein
VHELQHAFVNNSNTLPELSYGKLATVAAIKHLKSVT